MCTGKIPTILCAADSIDNWHLTLTLSPAEAEREMLTTPRFTLEVYRNENPCPSVVQIGSKSKRLASTLAPPFALFAVKAELNRQSIVCL